MCARCWQVEGYSVSMRRRDVGDVVEICHATGVDRWLVAKKSLNASKISAQVSICYSVIGGLNSIQKLLHLIWLAAQYKAPLTSFSCNELCIYNIL